MTITTIYAPERRRVGLYTTTIFLAGTIDMGNSVDWQTQAVDDLEAAGVEAVVYNPRRFEWDSSWIQDIANEQFREQVQWELDHISAADFVIVNFLPDSQSPITLMELGYIAGLGVTGDEVFVCCPEGYWRRGNVQVICDRHGIHVYDDMAALTQGLAHAIQKKTR